MKILSRFAPRCRTMGLWYSLCIQLVCVIAVCLSATRISAQTPRQLRPDPLLDRLAGEWVLQGPLAGRTTVHDVRARWVLNSEYLEMREVSRDRTADGQPSYDAIIYLVRDPRTRVYTALWLDNTDFSAFSPTGVDKGLAAGDSIPFVFTTSATSHIFTTFKYKRASDTWEWHIDNEENGTRRSFARLTLKRANSK
jgi:hypothetical protein